MLHILNGDSLRGTLDRSGVAGEHATWADALHDGPVSSEPVGGAAWREARADFIASAGWASRADALGTLAAWDAGVAAAPAHDEAVIWCEHDLFDQLLLMRHLAYFASRPAAERSAMTLSLICIDAYPGHPHFKGLGELAPADLASLFPTRTRVTDVQLALGARAWAAFASDDRSALARFVDEEDLSPLPFLGAALLRYLDDRPTEPGALARTDRSILDIVASGVTNPLDVWQTLHRRETCYYIADTSYLGRLRALASGSTPLITLTLGTERWFDDASIALTEAGRASL